MKKGIYSDQNILVCQNAFGAIGLYPGVCELIYVYNFHLLYVSYI